MKMERINENGHTWVYCSAKGNADKAIIVSLGHSDHDRMAKGAAKYLWSLGCNVLVIDPTQPHHTGCHNFPLECVEAAVFLGLFTAMVMIPTIKNPVLGALLAGADSFGDGFGFAVLLFAAVGAYDTLFLDWVLFARLKMFRLPGTKHMDKEYAQKCFPALFPLQTASSRRRFCLKRTFRTELWRWG